MRITYYNRITLVSDRSAERLVGFLDSDNLNVVHDPGASPAGGRARWTARRRGRGALFPLQSIHVRDDGVVGEEEGLHVVARQNSCQFLDGGDRFRSTDTCCCRRGLPFLQNVHTLES